MNLDWIIFDLLDFNLTDFLLTYATIIVLQNYYYWTAFFSMMFHVDLGGLYLNVELGYYQIEQAVLSLVNYFIFFDVGLVKKNYTLLFSNYYNYYSIVFNWSFVYSLKFSCSILFLIFIRAGLPRYRYDYLTKLGWAKFLLFSIYILILVYLIFLYL